MTWGRSRHIRYWRLGGLIRDPVLRDDYLLLVQHRGEQLHLPVRDAAKPFPVDRELSWRGEAEIRAGLLELWSAMAACVDAGCHHEGVLPGGLGTPRRAGAPS